MKGIGVSGGVSAGVRGGASGGIAAGKGVGSLCSPEARFGGAKASFSSRGLSRFNANPIGFKEIGGVKSPSIVNLNKGREAPKMFDLARLVRSDPVVPFKSIDAPKIIDINHGKGKISSVARTKSLEPKNIFDLGRKPAKDAPIFVRPKPVFLEPNKPQYIKSEAPVKASAKKAKIEAPKVIKADSMIKVRPVPETRVFRPETPYVAHSALKTSEVATTRKTEMPKPAVQVRLEQAIRVKSGVDPLVRRAVELDILEAVKTARIVGVARGMAEPQAHLEVMKVLAKKYEGKPGVEIITPPKTEIQPETQVKAITAAAVEVSRKAEKPEAVKTDQPEGAQKAEKLNGKEFFFIKDEKARKKRIAGALSAALRILKYKGADQKVPTGADLSYEMGRVDGIEQVSEVSSHLHPDGTWKGFLEGLKSLGEIPDISGLEQKVQAVIDLQEPVKMSFGSEGQVGEAGAVKVYEGSLEGQNGYFEENKKSTGRFEKSDGKLWFIPKII
ncbi:MAG: hypothetical protein ACM3IJ_06055 [Candidatus Levyibacteriota bacterium]